jgi:hypothetical protein
MKKLIRKTYQAETKALEDSDRTLIVKISTASPDRSNDVVMPMGMMVDNYLKNPVVAFAHNYSGLAIGKTLEIQKSDDGIIAKVEFVPKGVYPLADQLFEMYKGGFMNAWSIGFIPKKHADRDDGGRDFEEWELLEYSAVLVPDNPEALTLLRSKGVDVETLEKAMKVVVSEEEVKEDKNNDKKQVNSVVNFEVNAKEKTITLIMSNNDRVAFNTSDDYLTYLADILKSHQEFKEGRVLSEKNRKLIASVIDQMNAVIKAMQALLDATEKEPKEIHDERHKMVVDLTAALKVADQVIGRALRDVKSKGELGKDPDDTRVPVAKG